MSKPLKQKNDSMKPHVSSCLGCWEHLDGCQDKFKKRILYNFGQSVPKSERKFIENCTCGWSKSDKMIISCTGCGGTGARNDRFHHLTSCEGCGGRGSLFLTEVCQKCHGGGRFGYPWYQFCETCEGKGWTKLMADKQIQPYLTETEECRYCKGAIPKGKRRCTACKGAKTVLTLPGKIGCARCKNTGRCGDQKCSVCKGTGWAFFKYCL